MTADLLPINQTDGRPTGFSVMAWWSTDCRCCRERVITVVEDATGVVVARDIGLSQAVRFARAEAASR